MPSKCFLLAPLALTVLSSGASAQQWRSYGGDPGGTRFSSLAQITPQNVAQLKPAWTYHTGEIRRQQRSTTRHRVPPFESTPLVIDDVLYFSTPSNRIIALDAATGREIWQFDPQAGQRGPRHFHQHRGVAYWQDASGDDRRILFGTYDGRLIALDAATGKTRSDFGNHGIIDLRDGVEDRPSHKLYAVTSPPAIYRDLVITGAEVPEHPSVGPSGMVRAFNVRTGELAWTFHTVPQPGEVGHETWQGDDWKNRTGANVWSVMSVDSERGMVFLPIGSPSYDFYGADRKGQNLFGNSLVALDASTGKLIWYYQMVHHDVWDYDLPAQPVLITVHRDGVAVPAVAQVTKMGFIFILDRLTGNPLFSVEERPVPQSAVPGRSDLVDSTGTDETSATRSAIFYRRRDHHRDAGIESLLHCIVPFTGKSRHVHTLQPEDDTGRARFSWRSELVRCFIRPSFTLPFRERE